MFELIRCLLGEHEYARKSEDYIIQEGFAKNCIAHKIECIHCGKKMESITGVHKVATKTEGS